MKSIIQTGKSQETIIVIGPANDVMPDTRGWAEGLPIHGGGGGGGVAAGSNNVHAGTTSAPQASLQLLILPPTGVNM